MFLVPENGLVPSVQKVSFESKFNVFGGYYWGCSYEVDI